jgi:alkanesulfonate monooxygenase SsuD/methylene tetrahydromethanopterin reductase-like flavin-dependent oxidoreductase (luciferase family)
MRFGFVVPHADAREFAEFAALGERHGWDGVFTWEAVWGEHAWVALGAAAMVTERIRLGTLLTPASRWRPWDLASAVGTVDRLSGGRVVMSVGLGAVHDGWAAFEKPTDHMIPDPPVQRPRPPVWVVGARITGRSGQRSLARAARWDGLLPAIIENRTDRALADPSELGELIAEVMALRAAAGLAAEPYDVILEGDSSREFIQLDPPDPASWAAAGATWWIESWWTIQRGPDGLAETRRRIQTGPPSTA